MLELRFTVQDDGDIQDGGSGGAGPPEAMAVAMAARPSEGGPAVDAARIERMERMEQAMDKMSRQTECAICSELFVRPFQLAGCAHTFCMACIHAYLLKSADCPECRAPVFDPPTESRYVAGLVDSIVEGLGEDERQARRSLVTTRAATDTSISFDFLSGAPKPVRRSPPASCRLHLLESQVTSRTRR